MDEQRYRLVLREWEIWHTYASFVTSDPPPLATLARNLVFYGVAECAVTSDGDAWWSSDDPHCRPAQAGERPGRLGSGRVDVVLGADRKSAHITLPAGPIGFPREALFQSATLRYSELMLFGEGALPPPHVRAHVGACTFVADGYALVVYPQIKVFETGVVLVEFRMIGPPRPVYAREFIVRFLNAPFGEFREVLAPPGLVAWAPIALPEEGSSRWYRRPHTAFLMWYHRREVARRLKLHEDTDFAFQAVALTRREKDPEPETFHSLALTIMQVVAHVCGGVRKEATWIALGPKPLPQLGSHWTGRPHTHILRFARQAEGAVENEQKFGDDFGSILARVYFPHSGDGRRFLPKSARPIEDLGIYLEIGGTLWVHTRRSLRDYGNVPWADPNRGHLLHEHQVKAELLEYAYALHRRIADRALDGSGDMLDVLSAQRDLASFEWGVQDVSRFGEIRDLLENGWAALGIPVLRARISEVIRVRQTEVTHHDSVRTNRRMAFLTLLAGFLAVPPLAGAVVGPLWRLLRMPIPSNQDLANLVWTGTAMGLVALAVTAGYLWTRRGREPGQS